MQKISKKVGAIIQILQKIITSDTLKTVHRFVLSRPMRNCRKTGGIYFMSDSIITKKAMADSIKELMKKKSLEKITVSNIVKNCGLNRQTFYYHFKDKYDLVNWIYNSEVAGTISSVSAGADWSTAMLNVLNIMKKEKFFYIGSLNLDRQCMFHDFLFSATRDMLVKIIGQHNSREKLKIGASDCIFIAEFYTYGLVGMVIQWAKSGMKESPGEIVEKLAHFIDDSKRVSTARYQKKIDLEEVAATVRKTPKNRFPEI